MGSNPKLGDPKALPWSSFQPPWVPLPTQCFACDSPNSRVQIDAHVSSRDPFLVFSHGFSNSPKSLPFQTLAVPPLPHHCAAKAPLALEVLYVNHFQPQFGLGEIAITLANLSEDSSSSILVQTQPNLSNLSLNLLSSVLNLPVLASRASLEKLPPTRPSPTSDQQRYPFNNPR